MNWGTHLVVWSLHISRASLGHIVSDVWWSNVLQCPAYNAKLTQYNLIWKNHLKNLVHTSKCVPNPNRLFMKKGSETFVFKKQNRLKIRNYWVHSEA